MSHNAYKEEESRRGVVTPHGITLIYLYRSPYEVRRMYVVVPCSRSWRRGVAARRVRPAAAAAQWAPRAGVRPWPR